MKHENEPTIEQEQHERLCAYVFGELAGPERAAFEAELQRSSALRAEHERLQATIGLVRRAVPDEGLSAAVRRDLSASARRSRFKLLGGRQLARLAAAVVLLAGGALAVRFLAQPNGPFRYDVADGGKTARAPTPARTVERAVEHDAAAKGTPPSSARPPQDELAALRGLGYSTSAAGSAPSGTPALPREQVEALSAMGYSESGGVEVAAPASAETPLSLLSAVPAPVPARAEQAFDSSGFFLARGGNAQDGAEPAEAAPVTGATLAKEGKGAYRGPGDTRPPSSPPSASRGKAPRSPGSPGSPGSGASYAGRKQAQPQEPTLYDRAEVELRARLSGETRDEDGETRRQLDALGYGGEGVAEEPALDALGLDFAGRQPVQSRAAVAARAEELLATTRLAPGETPRAMFFRYWGDSPFVPTREQPSSTFAADVDTASYALTRAYLMRGELPPRAAVRTEEFVNYFKADQPAPTDGQPFALGLELAPSLFAGDARTEMLRVSVRARDVADFERQPVALTFVIDNSGSMRQEGRLDLVKRSLSLLLRQLYAGDSVAIVKFSNSAALVAPPTPVARRGELEGLIQGLEIEGGTNVEAGLRLGYETALQGLERHVVHRVILCSDGVGNIGEVTAKGLLALVDEARAKGIYLNTVGVGMGSHNDAFLEELADRGDGLCNYVDGEAEAKRVFVDQLASALQPVARDVKIQVEFDPAQVESWRLLGYENRALRTQDFRDDKIDAGEVNAGHQVSALYELVRLPSRSAPLATVRLRYKPPFAIDAGKEGAAARAESERALELERTLAASSVLPGFAAASNGYQRAVLVAQFAEVLRQSVHARQDALAPLLSESRRLEAALRDPDFSEFVALLARANPLLDARGKQETPKVQQLLDELSRLHYEQALRAHQRELARQAGEPAPEPSAEEQGRELGVRAELQRLEGELRAELLRQSGLEVPPDELRELGYGGDDR